MADGNNDNEKPSNSELMASAKVISEAVTGKETDTGKIAGAAADILDAASSYGMVDEKQGVGKYMDQAENYLHKYETSHTTTTTTTDDSGNKTTETTTTTHAAVPKDDDEK
uniref:nodulin-related protein 1-like n=1 Tax=Erigeron canadensis TaxID=72917 RepID=UPI001CB90AD4|nr:nodulin-related protein 1-like [Erigeron canadensis]